MFELSELKKVILDIISKSNGIKITELIVLLPEELIRKSCVDDIYRVIEELVKEKEIYEIEYTLPHMSYRIKSFLLPKGTEVHINGDQYVF